ncbi:MAG: hypothetical protein Q8O89_02790 [Nanoarchaeota archaeon]|nr:hypothetical protein [Nanoarchaeota archaeon]
MAQNFKDAQTKEINEAELIEFFKRRPSERIIEGCSRDICGKFFDKGFRIFLHEYLMGQIKEAIEKNPVSLDKFYELTEKLVP